MYQVMLKHLIQKVCECVCMCMLEVFPDSWMCLCHARLCYDIPVEVEGICLVEGFCLSMHVFRGSVCV